jgi:hypothetical protein
MQAPAETRAVVEADTFDEQDRRQAILAKFNLDLEQTKWPNHSFIPAERVSKQIRMRVRYTCHNCNTSFGYEKECNSCRHRRCARCDRYPPRKPRPAVESNIPAPAPVAPAETSAPEKSEAVMDHICTCHECQTVIELEVEECPNCHHTICDRCHREARLQSTDVQETDISSKQEEEDRKAPPEEQKLPPDSSTTEDQRPEEF